MKNCNVPSDRDGAASSRVAASGGARRRGDQRHRPDRPAVPQEAASHEGGEETQGGRRAGATGSLRREKILHDTAGVSVHFVALTLRS